MTEEQVRNIARADVVKNPSSAIENCWYLEGRKRLKGVSFMIIDRKVARIEIDSPKFSTLSGVGVGSTESQLKKSYGPSLQVEPHAYRSDSGHYLTLRSKDGFHGVRFEA